VPPPIGPAKPGNGLAVAALVLGILTFVCLGPIAGIAAVVLGILGVNKAKETGTGKGMAIAGIVLGIVGTIVFVIAIVAIAVAGDKANDVFDDAIGTADPDDYEVSLPPDACQIDPDGFVTFHGTIENTAGREMNFTVNATIKDSSDGVVLDTSSTTVSDIAEGDEVRWEITTVLDEAVDITCNVSGVDNWLN
jgi:hypothetical protein